MAAVGFYHLTRTGVEAALPPLLGRTLAAGERALVRAGGAARVAALDAALWLATNPDWLPHGTARTPHPEWQPIFLSETDENPAAARFLFLVDGVGFDPTEDFERVFDLFDGNDEAAVAGARARWRVVKAAGHEVTYWRQGAGGWEKG